MLPETAKPAGHSSAEGSGKSTKSFDKEVRDMVNAITHRVTALSHHKTAAGGREEEDHHQHVEEAEKGGARIITLAGTNTGATMRSELEDEMFKAKSGGHQDEEEEDDEETNVGTFVNSNCQAVNNSIMFGSSYNTNDPGVHVHISEAFEHQTHNNRNKQHGIKKGKRHEKETYHGEQEQHHQYSE